MIVVLVVFSDRTDSSASSSLSNGKPGTIDLSSAGAAEIQLSTDAPQTLRLKTDSACYQARGPDAQKALNALASCGAPSAFELQPHLDACMAKPEAPMPTSYTFSSRKFVPGTTYSHVPSVQSGPTSLVNAAERGEWIVYQDGQWVQGNLNKAHWAMKGAPGPFPPSGTWHNIGGDAAKEP